MLGRPYLAGGKLFGVAEDVLQFYTLVSSFGLLSDMSRRRPANRMTSPAAPCTSNSQPRLQYP